MIKPVYEFLLWENCRNNCKFCFQTNKKQLDRDGKARSMTSILRFLLSDEYVKGSHILLVGGEIFDSPDIFDLLDIFLTRIIDLMNSGDIDLLYINTNLIYKQTYAFEEFLHKISANSLFNRLKFTTSYDIEGRFTSDKTRQLMLSNLDYLTKTYEELNAVVNVILTHQACKAILKSEFSPKCFEDQYRCKVSLVPYIVRLDDLASTQSKIFASIIKASLSYSNPTEYLLEYIRNLDLKQEKKLYKFDGQQLVYCSSDVSECGHSENFKLYSKDNTCFICDFKKLVQSIADF